ncbi:MAG: hypothetical protein R6V10_08320 [bacterium]
MSDMAPAQKFLPIYFKRALWFLVIAAAALLAGLAFYGFTFDDPYITFRVARNLADGHGWVYNAGERTNAVTSPLHTLLLAFLYYVFSADLPLLGALVTMAGLAAAGFVFPFLCDRDKNPAGAYLAGAVIGIYPFLIQTMGMETGLLLAICLASLYFYRRERLVPAAALLALALLVRFDAAVLAGIVLVHYLYKERALPPGRAVAAFALVLAPWFVFSGVYFGELLPHTLGVKLAQSRSGAHWGGEWMFLQALGGVLARFLGEPDVTGLLGYAALLAGLVHVFRTPAAAPRIILAWALLHAVAYAAVLRVPPYTWYFAPVYLSLAMLLGLGAGSLAGRLASSRYGGNVLLAVALLFVLLWTLGKALPGFDPLERWFNPFHLGHALGYLALVIGGITFSFQHFRDKGYARAGTAFWIALAAFFPHHLNGYLQMTHGPGSQYVYYREAAQWVRENRPQARTVGAHEIGVLGYYLKDKTIVDQCGIPTEGAAKALGRRDMTWWVKKYRPDLLVLHCSTKWWKEVEGPLLAADWFTQAYRPVAAVVKAGETNRVQAVALDNGFGGKSDGACPVKEPAKHAVKVWELVDLSAVPAPSKPETALQQQGDE